MHDELWAGPELKLDYASFHFQKMATSVSPRERTAYDVGYIATADAGPQRAMFTYFDAFLSAARSIPEIIQCCFGHDLNSHMRLWFDGLELDEQKRRDDFRNQWTDYATFRNLRLSNTRHTIEHRRGYASDLEAKVTGRFGVVYVGGPAKPILATEMPPIDNPQLPLMVGLTPVEPRPDQFTINGEPLFDVCRAYLDAAQKVVTDSRAISNRVHGGYGVTPPPDA